jgi:GntR family transcriptional regulator of vanillate catabolism
MDTQLARATLSVRQMILRGRLKAGQRVTEVMLAQILGMSRTPVRQALPVLAREGLLVESGTRGYLVRTFTRSDILDAIDLRGVLEGFAVRRARRCGASPALLHQLQDCLEEGDRIFRKRHLVDSDEAAFGAMNDRFHGALLAAGQSVRAEFLMCEHVNTVKSSINMLQLRDPEPDQASALRLVKS